MIVDVLDLNFNKDNLDYEDVACDFARRRRAEKLHLNEDVLVKKVNKVVEQGNKKYTITADVLGNCYKYYETKIYIKNSKVVEDACSCECEDYGKGYFCKHLMATIYEIMEPHYASTPEGKKIEQKRKEEEEKKRIEEEKKRQEEMRKKRIYQDVYRYSLNILDNYNNDKAYKKFNEILDLDQLYEISQINQASKPTNLATNLSLECIVELTRYGKLELNFKVGNGKMYVLKNVIDFYDAYKEQTELYMGKQLSFIPKRENFVDMSKPLFDLIIKYAEMIEYGNELIQGTYSYRYNPISSKSITVSGSEIDEIIKASNNSLTIKTYEGNKNYVRTDEKIDIHGVLTKEKVDVCSCWFESGYIKKREEYILRTNIRNFKELVIGEKSYIFYNEKIYFISDNKKIRKLLDIFCGQNFVVIPEDRLDDFRKNILKDVEYEDKITGKENSVIEIVDDFGVNVLFDANDDGDILLELKFCYGEHEFNILNKNYEKDIEKFNIVRNIPKERDIITRIFSDGFEYSNNNNCFFMKNDGSIYNFFCNKIDGYMNDFEVLATDKFKNKKIKQPKISNIGIRVDNGLLQLDLSKINIDMDEIKDVMKNYSIKKKYYKLKNGDFLDLTQNTDLDLLEELSSTLDIDYGKLSNGKVSLPVNRSIYLDKLMDANNIKTTKNDKFNEIVDNISNSNSAEDIEVSEEFENKLRDYQKYGYKWLKTLEKYNMGGILADDMGLGKTLQVIALLKSGVNKEQKATSIVVCPSTLVLNWKAEIKKWCNDIKVLVIRGTAEERKVLLEKYLDYDVIIISYDLLKRDIEQYEDIFFKYVIADEAQYIKNSTTQNATALKSLKGENKFALTGTPIENSAAELWSIFDFIMPGYLYNYNKFKKKFEEPILKQQDEKSLVRLKKLISPFVLRRVKKDVLTELPDKNIMVVKNEMEPEQEKIYLSYLAQTKKEIAEELSGSSFEKSKFKILMLLTRLRQICCHPGLFIDNYEGASGKLKQCMDLVNEAIESGHKILLFSSYTSMFNIIEQEFNKQGINYYKLIGSTPVSKRVEMVDSFNNNEDVKVFLISLKAGGTGLNLTSADVVIHYDPWWNVSSENQATDRAYRMGQKNSVQVYKLITSNSIEEKINAMQERKEQLSKDILSTEETMISKMSKEEILDLFAN